MVKILVIDDEMLLRLEVMEWLSLEGYDVIGAEDGMEGIAQAYEHVPDLIICDITMPRMDGYGVLLELRTNPLTMAIPFIFVSARAAYEDLRQGMDLGADDYITKPFTLVEFLQAVQTRLEKKAAQEQARQREIDAWQQAFEQEREQRLLKAKLVGMFSHDFRNPLASILSSSSLLRNYANRMDETRRLTHFDRIEASVRQLDQMLEDMLIISQMEAGSLKFEPNALNIGEFLQGIIEEFQMIYGETHEIIYENHLPGVIQADARLIRQIASNLISNAIKYSPQGHAVRVSLEEGEKLCSITVQDQGIGIPEAERAHLFDAFQRASNVGRVQGTGLGLAIVQQAADLHGGTIQLESQLGLGTTVMVSLPC